jgi:hypothetical protein
MTIIRSRLAVLDPVALPVAIDILPLAQPDISKVARCVRDGHAIVAMHPDCTTEEAIDDGIEAMLPDETCEWMQSFGVPVGITIPYKEFTQDPMRYLHHLRHLRTLPDAIPPGYALADRLRKRK